MKKIEYNKKIEFLEKEYEKALQDLKDLQEFYSFYLGNEVNFSSVLKRAVDGTLSNNDKQFLSDLLKCYRYLHEIEERVNKTKSIQEYQKQIADSYFNYQTQQEWNKKLNSADMWDECYQTYIPDEVETGYIPIGEFDEEECHDINMFELNSKPVGPIYQYEKGRKVDRAKLQAEDDAWNSHFEQNVRMRAAGSKEAGNFDPCK